MIRKAAFYLGMIGLLAVPLLAQVELKPSVNDNGGGTIRQDGLDLLGSIGQAVPGVASGSGQTVYSGFVFIVTLPSGQTLFDTISVMNRGETVEFPTAFRPLWATTNGEGYAVDYGLVVLDTNSWSPDGPWPQDTLSANLYYLFGVFTTDANRPTLGSVVDPANRITRTVHWSSTADLGSGSDIAAGAGRWLWLNMIAPRYYTPDPSNLIHLRWCTRAHLP